MNEIEYLVSQIKNLKDIVIHAPPITLVHRTTVFPPVSFDSQEIEARLSIKIPVALRKLWKLVSEINLFKEINYGQWGLILKGPDQIIDFHDMNVDSLDLALLDGDLIVGGFKGDQELILVRCNPHEGDYGAIVVALPLYSRGHWPIVASNLTEFIDKFLQSPLTKYWEAGA